MCDIKMRLTSHYIVLACDVMKVTCCALKKNMVSSTYNKIRNITDLDIKTRLASHDVVLCM
jgi:hypothetical protein